MDLSGPSHVVPLLCVSLLFLPSFDSLPKFGSTCQKYWARALHASFRPLFSFFLSAAEGSAHDGIDMLRSVQKRVKWTSEQTHFVRNESMGLCMEYFIVEVNNNPQTYIQEGLA